MTIYKTLSAAGLCFAMAACQTTTEVETVSEPSTSIASNAKAASICASDPISHRWAFQNGDQSLSAEALSARVKGKTITSNTGSQEQYRRNGSYAFVAGDQIYDAPGYVLYADGSRCIAYDNPRYDMYVVNGGKLVLINQQGGRFVTE